MSNSNSRHVNPYIIELARMMYIFETKVVCKETGEPYLRKYASLSRKKPLDFSKAEDIEIFEYLRDPITNKILLDAKGNERTRWKTFGLSGFVRRIFYETGSFTFTNANLDLLASSISFFGEFDNWDTLEKEFSKHKGAKWAEHLVGIPKNEFRPEDLILLEKYVEKYFNKESIFLIQSGKTQYSTYKNVIRLPKMKILRQAEKSDLKFIEQLQIKADNRVKGGFISGIPPKKARRYNSDNRAKRTFRLSSSKREEYFKRAQENIFVLVDFYMNVTGAVVIPIIGEKAFDEIKTSRNLIVDPFDTQTVESPLPFYFYALEIVAKKSKSTSLIINNMHRIMKRKRPNRHKEASLLLISELLYKHVLEHIGFSNLFNEISLGGYSLFRIEYNQLKNNANNINSGMI